MYYKTLGLTDENCNYRLTAEQKEDRVMIVAKEDDCTSAYYFNVPSLWKNVISDYLELVQKAHPNAKVMWTIDGDIYDRI